ncbi:MAG: hypothetical protein NC177_02240 [Ruminococcus flavefaciens]|nr:hypothetical protein [Ruminococcus flavefaciens]
MNTRICSISDIVKEMFLMLFVQEVDIWYRKNVRYPKYANIRNALKFIPVKTENINPDCEVFYQRSMFRQSPDGIQLWNEDYRKFNGGIFTSGSRDRMENLRNLIRNIRIFQEDGNYKIMFCDDYFHERCNISKRRGSNEGYWDNNSPFSYTDVVNQTAFILKPDEYGRIMYNDRTVMHHTEIWYYCIHTVNFVNCDKSKFREKMFFKKVLDYEYKNMQYLKYC